jgi:NAD(P)-dependent dehydrogenase (short-subunit alcohol dehydrogenase family)
MTKVMTLDLAPEGVECVLIHPGYVRTDMTGEGWDECDVKK